ncbi:MAG: CDP-alcohol phosphatidyltransferase family protein [Deltaproteobacteria bacterium]|nr:CDP-alcohol phosphatidyltransferase family protein [Deltaproteobacteria bacterium]MBW2360198.1 CDP-alcohol phosphatidyltransferase family protein [Deltaproteobacteria bacterium]
MIKAKVGDRIDGWLKRGLPFLFVRRVNPNTLTVTGACVSLVAAYQLSAGAFVAGGLLILVGGAFDLIDGVVARHHGSATSFGAFLDSTLDRVVDMALLLGITLYFARQGDVGLVLLTGYALAVSVLVSYAQAKAEQVVPGFKVGLFERGERIVVLAAGSLFGLLVPALWLVALGSSVTVVQRFARAYREMTLIDAGAASLGEQTR